VDFIRSSEEALDGCEDVVDGLVKADWLVDGSDAVLVVDSTHSNCTPAFLTPSISGLLRATWRSTVARAGLIRVGSLIQFSGRNNRNPTIPGTSSATGVIDTVIW